MVAQFGTLHTPVSAIAHHAARIAAAIVSSIFTLMFQQGWAPAPTNEVQQAIWDKVHQIPDKPITIEFDPKTDK